MWYPPEDNQGDFQPSEGLDMGLRWEAGIRLWFRKGSRRLGGPPRARRELQDQLERKEAELGCRRASLRRWGSAHDCHLMVPKILLLPAGERCHRQWQQQRVSSSPVSPWSLHEGQHRHGRIPSSPVYSCGLQAGPRWWSLSWLQTGRDPGVSPAFRG